MRKPLVPLYGKKIPLESKFSRAFQIFKEITIMMQIHLLECPIPPSPLRPCHKKSGNLISFLDLWLNLGNKKSYQRSAGVRTKCVSVSFE